MGTVKTWLLPSASLMPAGRRRCRRVEIVDGERARGHRALVDLIAVLLHRHLSVAAGNPVDNRGKSLPGCPGSMLSSGELRAPRKLMPSKTSPLVAAVAQIEARTQRGDVARSSRAIDVLPLVSLADELPLLL